MMVSKQRAWRGCVLLAALIVLSSCATKSFNHPFGVQENRESLIAGLFDPLASLYPDTDIPAGAASITTDIPRNAAGGVVLLVGAPADAQWSLQINSSDNNQPVFHELVDIPVLENTGFFGMTENQLGFDNRSIVRHAPFSIFEVLVPSDREVFAGKTVYAFYLKKRVGPKAQEGTIRHKIRISDEKGRLVQELTWNLTVHPVLLPEGPKAEMWYTNWFRGPQEGFEELYDEDWW
ncbi:MAG: hypothetical protein P1P77_16840, partial [Spirochaetaceae bacterium]|nr:hypothetical protein [Spirochaetaceae bacterium]